MNQELSGTSSSVLALAASVHASDPTVAEDVAEAIVQVAQLDLGRLGRVERVAVDPERIVRIELPFLRPNGRDQSEYDSRDNEQPLQHPSP